MAAAAQLEKALRTLRWIPAYGWQRLVRRPSRRPVHLLIALADHFEPSTVPGAPGVAAPMDEQLRRVERWCRSYPAAVGAWRDADGRPLCHTYFFPAEEYDKRLIDRLAAHCQQGWGEIEIHLHHGIGAPDTSENTRRQLVEFRDTLAAHGCLSRWEDAGAPRYAFVHGNWALANSGGGRYCGVDDEMRILAETGCYADLTLPSAPDRSQTAKINALYECARPLDRRAPHRHGRDLRVGRAPRVYPLIVQGPLALSFERRGARRLVPRIENGEVTSARPAMLSRLARWRRTAISVAGRPDWVFVKLHCHGMVPADEAAMLGTPMRRFLSDLVTGARHEHHRLHFVTAREMVNIALAACDGREGDPGQYRDYRLRLITPPTRA